MQSSSFVRGVEHHCGADLVYFFQLRVARAFRNVLDDIDERRSIQSFASARSSRSSRSRRLQWQRRPTASIESTVSDGGGVYAASAAMRRGYFATSGASNTFTAPTIVPPVGLLTVSVDEPDMLDGAYINMGLAADSRRASTKSRSYENVSPLSSAMGGASCVVMATSPSAGGSLQPRFTKQTSLPVTIAAAGGRAPPSACNVDYMSTHDSDVDIRQFSGTLSTT